MKKRKSIGKNLSRLFLAFLSSVFLASFLLLLSLYLTLFSSSYMDKQAEKSDYYSLLTEEINRQIENSALGSNIPAGVLAEAVSEDYVKEDVNAYFTAMYNPKETFSVVNGPKINESILTKIKQYAAENNIEVTAETEASIQTLADRSVEIYDGYIELPFLISFTQRVIAYKSKLLLFMAVCGVLCVLLSIILFKSLRGYLHRLLRYLEYIFAGSGLLMLTFPTVIFLSGSLKRLGIQSKAMYDFVQAYLSSFLWMFIFMGLVAVVLGILFAFLSEYQRRRLFRQ
ncbi:hypothetical protein [Candidatus Enterococcus clewellii]|uniref:Cell division protein FtsX n=1 Tax=Candidatus Enterococcus clewellii TaxID=1834193 RepID=A0A242KE54_9ENTE|nr:hypothetical protein [Enterococcus sp. 9E7_DIV0242]OTP19337.1 hypothetical protein A5888_001154 [Enterococcus sp. 9E7_DIV0242]